MNETLSKSELIILSSREYDVEFLGERAVAEISELRAIPRMRFWNCPCGDLVIREEHYDLECGKCKRVQTDENEFEPDIEISKLREAIELHEYAQGTDRLVLAQESDRVRADNTRLREALQAVWSSPHHDTCSFALLEDADLSLCDCHVSEARAALKEPDDE